MVAVKTKNVKCAELIWDQSVYPRHRVDETHIKRIDDAEQVGQRLPPIIVCRKTRRIADGVHRWKQKIRRYGKEAEIEAIEQDYQDDAEFFLAAIALNAGHGVPLAPLDRQRILRVGEGLKLTREALCGAMAISVKRIEATSINRQAAGGTILKRSIEHMAGKPLSARQQAANDKLTGQRQDFIINQVIELLEAELINRDDPQTMAALDRLKRAIEEFV